MLEELLDDPEKFRIGDNYRGTNIVFPVRFRNERYIVKKPRFTNFLAYAWYVLLDKLYYESGMKFSGSRKAFHREAEKLRMLNGFCAPRLITHADGIIIREYIEGDDIRHMHDRIRRRAIEEGFNALVEIHRRGVVICDALVKNFVHNSDGAYWNDFDGVFDESDLVRAKAVDVLKFVYSTYTCTRDGFLALHSAHLASSYYDKDVRDRVGELVTPGCSALRLWLPTRLPLDGKLNERIKRVLRS